MIESAEWCELIPAGTDADGTEWDWCAVHDCATCAYICEGYTPPPYVDPSATTPVCTMAQRDATRCSDDVVEVWHGMETPAIGCGYHATYYAAELFAAHRELVSA